MEWSDAQIEQLRALWAAGHSGAEIGRRMKLSKNAVVGKKNRLDLPDRPSPIVRTTDGVTVRYLRVARVAGPTLPPLLSAPVVVAAPPRPPTAATSVLIAPPRSAPARRPILKAEAPHPTAPDCQFLLNDAAPWKFCARTDMAAGKSYCTFHAAICFRRVRDEREIADATD